MNNMKKIIITDNLFDLSNIEDAATTNVFDRVEVVSPVFNLREMFLFYNWTSATVVRF